MPLITALLLVMASAVGPNAEMPSDFLKVESKAWSKWLDEKIDVSWGGVALREVLADQFGPPALTVDPAKALDLPITFDVRDTSRRVALWRLSQRFGFTIRWAQKDEPKVFMGLCEAEHRDHNVGGRRMVEITQVMRSDYKSYQDWKQRGEVTKEEVVDGILYYAIDVDRDVHFGGPQGMVAHVIEVQRYKTVPPAGINETLPLAPEGKTWKLVWHDEFDGTKLDTSKWDVPEYKRRDGYWTRKSITLDGKGHLVMSVLKEWDKFLDGCVRTKGKFEHSFGYYVTRIQLQKQPGHWSAFWIMGDGVGKVGSGGREGTEIDIYEKPWLDDRVQHTLHWDGYGKNHKSKGNVAKVPGVMEGWHTFGLWWKPDEYIFYVDGKETWRTKAGGVCQVPEYMKLSDEIGNWAGDIKKAKLPDAFLVDYVRVYDVVEKKEPIKAAKVQIELFDRALELYQLDIRAYPTTKQGLQALRIPPSDLPDLGLTKWQGPYLEKDVPLDPWGKPYHYRLPGVHNPKNFDLWSVGPDGKEIGNWK